MGLGGLVGVWVCVWVVGLGTEQLAAAAGSEGGERRGWMLLKPEISVPRQQEAPFGTNEWCEQQWHAKMKEEGGFSGLAARGTSNESLTAAEGREGGERRDWLPLPPGILVPRQQGILQGEHHRRDL